jgi:gas vesicle protein
MGFQDDLDYVVIEERAGGLLTFLMGAVVGAGVALLLAPRSGPETQQEIADAARRLRDGAGDRMDAARSRMEGVVSDRVEGLREIIAAQAERARTAMDEGRRAAREARVELEHRLSEARGRTRADPRGAESLTDDELVIGETEVEDDLPGSELG